jgi:hypothetical protein
MEAAVLDELERTLSAEGPAHAVEHLCDSLRQAKDYNGLFYALLLKKRQELGVSPVPTGPSTELPPETHAPYEEAIRDAARQVGGLFLAERNLPQAWAYFRMLGEPEPVRAAIDRYEPAADEDIQPIINVAFYEGAHPEKGFRWVLQRYGLCSAITTLSSQELPFPPETKFACVRLLVRALYAELRERLAAEVARRDGTAPAEPTDEPGAIHRFLAGRDWLFADDYYHVDVSHLSSVVQMAAQLPPGPDLELARELCEYGSHLSDRFQNAGEPPFEKLYEAYGHYFAAVSGDSIESSLDYFRKQAADADPETVGTFPAEVLVNLLLRLDRPAEALAVARRYLSDVASRRLTCPSLAELCQKVGDYTALTEAARKQGDAVHFLAGLLAAKA